MEALLNHTGRQTAYHIGELSEIASARRAGNDLARRLGFDEIRTGQLALVITEAATNIVKHAREGELLLRALHANGRAAVEVLALDRGPGMGNVALRMEDGHSTAGTYGVGLGAIERLTQEFDIYTADGQGTALVMVVWADGQCAPDERWELGVVCLPLAGEVECGDAWSAAPGRHGLTVCVADGLGHGPDAASASAPAVEVGVLHPHSTPATLMKQAHAALNGTRGAAMAIAAIDPEAEQLTFCGVGNIAGCVIHESSRRHLMSHNGIVGSNLRKVQEMAMPFPRGALLVMHSDGLGTRWDMGAYPGLASRHPALVAGVLYRDFVRGRDDTLVLAVRERSALR